MQNLSLMRRNLKIVIKYFAGSINAHHANFIRHSNWIAFVVHVKRSTVDAVVRRRFLSMMLVKNVLPHWWPGQRLQFICLMWRNRRFDYKRSLYCCYWMRFYSSCGLIFLLDSWYYWIFIVCQVYGFIFLPIFFVLSN